MLTNTCAKIRINYSVPAGQTNCQARGLLNFCFCETRAFNATRLRMFDTLKDSIFVSRYLTRRMRSNSERGVPTHKSEMELNFCGTGFRKFKFQRTRGSPKNCSAGFTGSAAIFSIATSHAWDWRGNAVQVNQFVRQSNIINPCTTSDFFCNVYPTSGMDRDFIILFYPGHKFKNWPVIEFRVFLGGIPTGTMTEQATPILKLTSQLIAPKCLVVGDPARAKSAAYDYLENVQRVW